MHFSKKGIVHSAIVMASMTVMFLLRQMCLFLGKIYMLRILQWFLKLKESSAYDWMWKSQNMKSYEYDNHLSCHHW